MSGKTSYHANYFTRPVKSAGKRRQRVKAQKRRLIAAGMTPAVAGKLNVRETREALKKIKK